MAVVRERPYGRGNFSVSISGGADKESVVAGFSHVVLPEGRAEAVDYRTGNEKSSAPRKLPGCIDHGKLLLKRGVIGSLDLYEWWQEVRDGGLAMRTVTVDLLTEDRQATVLTWKFNNVWPVRYGFEPLTTEGCGPATEYMELAFEIMQIE
jgi:phage tail-like protein